MKAAEIQDADCAWKRPYTPTKRELRRTLKRLKLARRPDVPLTVMVLKWERKAEPGVLCPACISAECTDVFVEKTSGVLLPFCSWSCAASWWGF